MFKSTQILVDGVVIDSIWNDYNKLGKLSIKTLSWKC